MPPRSASNRGGSRGSAPSAPSARGSARGRGAGRGVVQTGGVRLPVGLASGAPIKTIGVKRPGFGTAGKKLEVITNNYEISHPDVLLRHYDEFSSDFHPRIRRIILKQLETEIAPQIFTDKYVFDGKKNMFTSYELNLGESTSRRFEVTLSPPGATGDRPPKVHTVTVTKVNEINLEVLNQFVAGRYSLDEEVLTAIMALNVVVRMDPSEKYPFNVRSFFTNRETRDIGSGFVLWRGYFQSVRPGIGRMLLNVDISTAMMYKSGRLPDLCLEFLGQAGKNPSVLAPARGFPDRERLRLQRFLSGLKITTAHTPGTRPNVPRVIKKLTAAGADGLHFNFNGTMKSVADYFRTEKNRPLQFPGVICVEVGSGALLPLEMCFVPEGQIMKKQIPPDKTTAMVEFATMKPNERFRSIENGSQSVLAYGQSEYVRKFGMTVETANGFLPIDARVLPPPTLRYGQTNKQPTIQPRNGAWNMIDKSFFIPESIVRWVVVSYASRGQFSENSAKSMILGLLKGCEAVGMPVQDKDPIVRWENPQGKIADQLRAAGAAVAKNKGSPPNLIVVILPDANNAEIYTAVKNFGDIMMGVATQCLKAGKCSRAKDQYWANVCLKINPKLGGINAILDPSSARVLNDPKVPTIVMGADAMHPAPGSEGRPSFTAVVGNIDSNNARYIATTRAQTSKQELIDDLQEMCKHILGSYAGYRVGVEKKPASEAPPKRLIFFRDGVSEGQFEQVLQTELPRIKAACAELKMNPKITLIIVGKRHHVRFKTQKDSDADKSGNCPAGTVVDQKIGHPTEFDFFLQSHGGLLGTSRPAHYSVLYDENGFNADAMQALSFALCHVYARATRSVSIPAPVYYADIVCSRAKHHYDPNSSLNLSDTATQASAGADTLESFKRSFMPLHKNTSKVMYFS